MGEFKTLTYEDLRTMYFKLEKENRDLKNKIFDLEEKIGYLQYELATN